MASKNLGAVIQRAISDGAFRRQLQSDPAAALRGFNLTPDEIAAIRSGDSSKLMSLGIDQRMSKAYSVSGSVATRSSVSDGTAAGTSSALTDTAGAHETVIGDPTSGGQAVLDPTSGAARSALNPGDTASTSDMLTTGGLTGSTRALHEDAPFDSGRASFNDPTIAGSRSVNDVTPFEGNANAVTTGGDLSGTRAVNDSAPFEGNANAVTTGGDLSGTRAVNDSAPFDGSVSSAVEDVNSPEYAARITDVNDSNIAAANAGRGGSLTGDMSSGTGDNLAAAEAGRGGSLTGDMSADDNLSVASRMSDANLADATRAVNDVAPFEGSTNAVTDEFVPTNELRAAEHHIGGDTTNSFIPADSADVQREMLDGGLNSTGGDALASGGGHTES
jgi:hypothetical protein